MVRIETPLDFAAKRNTVHYRHHDIAYDQIHFLYVLNNVVPCLLPVTAFTDMIFPGKLTMQITPYRRLVLHDQYTSVLTSSFLFFRQFGYRLCHMLRLQGRGINSLRHLVIRNILQQLQRLRHLHDETRTLAFGIVFRPNTPLMQLYQQFRQIQSDTGTDIISAPFA